MEWLAVAVGTLAVIITIFLRGKDAGKVSADSDTQKEVLDNVAKAKKAADSVASDGINTVRDRLRDNARK